MAELDRLSNPKQIMPCRQFIGMRTVKLRRRHYDPPGHQVAQAHQ
jgi:hypothetical protein